MPIVPGLFDDTDEKQSSPDFDTILSNSLGHEGGYTVDHAGPTNKGVTQKAYDSYRISMELPSRDVKTIRDEEVRDLYASDYFESPGLNKLPHNVAGVMFDFGINSSPDRAIKTLQRVVGTVPDGDLGPKTLAATEKFVEENGEDKLVDQIITKRSNFLDKLVEDKPEKYKKFQNGWKNRLNKLREQYITKPLSALDNAITGVAYADEVPQETGVIKGLFDDEPVVQQEAGVIEGLFDDEQTLDPISSVLRGLKINGESVVDMAAARGKSDLDRIQEQLPNVTVQDIQKSFERGSLSAELDQASYLALIGELDYDKDVRPLREAQDRAIKADPIKGKNVISQAIYSVSEMLPAMGVGMGEGAVTGSVAGGMAAAGGVTAPLALPMYVAGQVAGSYEYWRRQGAGQIYAQMKANEIPDEVAKPISHIAGAMYGAIEFSQIDKLIPGAKNEAKILVSDTLKKTIGRLALKYGANWMEEVGEEGLQQVVDSTAQEVANTLTGKSDKDAIGVLSKVLSDGWKASKDSALPMLLLMTPSAAFAGKDIAVAEKMKGEVRREMVRRVMDEARAEEQKLAKDEQGQPITVPPTAPKAAPTGISVGITPEMEGAKDGGLPAIEVKPAEVKEVETALEKSNLSEERRAEIIKKLEGKPEEKPRAEGVNVFTENWWDRSVDDLAGNATDKNINSMESQTARESYSDPDLMRRSLLVADVHEKRGNKERADFIRSQVKSRVAFAETDIDNLREIFPEYSDEQLNDLALRNKERNKELEAIVNGADANISSVNKNIKSTQTPEVSKQKAKYNAGKFSQDLQKQGLYQGVSNNLQQTRNVRDRDTNEILLRHGRSSDFRIKALKDARTKLVELGNKQAELLNSYDEKTRGNEWEMTPEIERIAEETGVVSDQIGKIQDDIDFTIKDIRNNPPSSDQEKSDVVSQAFQAITPSEQPVAEAKEPLAEKEQVAGLNEDEIAKALADRLKQNLADYHRKFAKAVIEKDAVTLSRWMATAESANKNSRAVFTQFTGVKLPSTIEGKRKAIYEWTGQEIPKPIEKAPEPQRMTKEEATKKMVAARDEKVLASMIRYQGQLMTKKQMVDSLVAKGWVPIVSTQPKIKDLSRRAYNNMDGRQQAEFERRQREAGTKEVYYLEEKAKGIMVEVGKVGYDYAKSKATSKKEGNWRDKVNNEPDIFVRGSMLRTVADSKMVKDDDLKDVIKMAVGMSEEGNILWSVSRNPNASDSTKKEALDKYNKVFESKEEQDETIQPGEQEQSITGRAIPVEEGGTSSDAEIRIIETDEGLELFDKNTYKKQPIKGVMHEKQIESARKVLAMSVDEIYDLETKDGGMELLDEAAIGVYSLKDYTEEELETIEVITSDNAIGKRSSIDEMVAFKIYENRDIPAKDLDEKSFIALYGADSYDKSFGHGLLDINIRTAPVSYFVNDPHFFNLLDAVRDKFPQITALNLPQAVKELKKFKTPVDIYKKIKSLPVATQAVKEQEKIEEETALKDFGEKIGGARKDTAERGFGRATVKKDKTGPSWANKYVAAEKVDKSGWILIKKDAPTWMLGSIRDSVQKFATKEEAEKAIPIRVIADTHRVYQNKAGKWEIFKKVGERKLFKVVNKEFSSREEATTYMAVNAEDILNIKTTFGEEILPVPEIAVRKGIERRKGNATPEMFMETFAPRGIEFGNWNNQDERQLVLNHAYDGLLDLSDILGISPKDLMLGGELGIAFGARGHGLQGAKAHFEPDYNAINLTKMKGAGSLAHEWFHALDNYLAKIDGKAKTEKIKNSRGDLVFPYRSTSDVQLSYGFSYNSKLDKDIIESYRTLINSLFRKAEKYVENTETADKFLSAARENLDNELLRIRMNLEKDFTKEYTYRKSKKGLGAASSEQLADFDRLANILIEGGNLSLTVTKVGPGEKLRDYRTTNDTLEAINKIMKDVRNRQGFSADGDGALDRVTRSMKLYSQRLAMFRDAKNNTEKEKSVPTNFAIEAKKMDQARAGEYWSEPNEMIARAFAAYVEDKISERGWQSDFIVYHAHGGILVPMIDGFVGRPYPEGAEREAINKELDTFISKTRRIFQDRAIDKAASGQENVIVTKDERKAAADRINSKLRRLSANPMLDPELWADLLKVGTFHLERGARTFSVWSERMVNEFGEAIKPHLDNIWKDLTKDTPKTDVPPVPVATGDKTAKAASDINLRIVDKGMSEIQEDELASYTAISKKEQLELVAGMITNDPDGTKEMAMGLRAIPSGVSPQVLFNAVKNKAILESDAETIKALAKSPVATERSLLAQKLGAAGYDNGMTEADPISAVNEISKVREDNKEENNKKVAELEAKLAEAEKRLAEVSSKQAARSRKSASFGSRNRIVTKEMADEAIKKFFSIGKVRGSAFGADILAEKLFEAGKVGTFYLEGGIREFGEWSSAMVEALGNEIKPHLDTLWKESKKQLSAENRDVVISKVMSGLSDGYTLNEIGLSVQPLAEYLVSQGVDTRDALVDAIHALFLESGQSVTKREVADAISGYGKFKPLNDDEIMAKLRDIKGQLQQVSKIEDLQKKIAPAKTGIERRTPSDEERRLIKQVEELKKQSGIVSLDPARQLRSALESIKTRLNNQIKDLEAQIASRQKIVKEKRTVELDKEAQELTARRDELKREFDAIFTKPGITDQQRIEIATRAVIRSITILENKIKSGDIEVKKPKPAVTSKQLEELRARRESLKGRLQELRDAVNPPLSEGQKAINALKSRLISQRAKLERQLADNDFAKKQKPAIPETPEIKLAREKLERTRVEYNAAKSIADGVTDAELQTIVGMSKAVYDAKDKMRDDFTWENKQDGVEFGAANVAFKKYVAKLKQDAKGSGLVNPLEGKTLADKYKRAMQDFKVIFNFIADNSKAILGSLDNSFHGRQGIKALTNPRYQKVWLNNFIQSWGNIWTTLKGRIGRTSVVNAILGKDAIDAGEMITDAVIADAYSRKNYLNGRYNKGVRLDIATGEEAFPTSFPSRIPVLGRLFKASEVSYEASAMRLRMDIADTLYDLAEKSGQDMNDKQIIGDINQIANEMTGRGGLGRGGSGKAINRTFFSIKNAKSNVDFLLRPFYPNQSDFARQEAAKNLAISVVMIAVILAIAKAFDDDSTDLDPRGDMFGKLKLGKGIVIDITGGISGFVIIAARLLTMTSKSSRTGVYSTLGESFGKDDGADMLVRFATNKLSPIAGAIRDYLKQRNFDNKKPTFTSTATGLITPIPSQNVIELASKDEEMAVKLGAIILDGLGFGMSYRDMSKDWDRMTSKEMLEFREKVGEERFKEANDKYNDLFNDRIDFVINSEKYKDLDDESKKRIIRDESEEVKDRVLRSYGYKYKVKKLPKLPNI